MERLEEWLLSLVECVWRDQCDIVREARLSGNKLEQSSGCGEAVDKAVQQHGVSSVLVKYVVGSVIREVCGSVWSGWRRMCWTIRNRMSSIQLSEWRSG